MSVYNRIKILQCKDLEDLETKINEFFSTSQDIAMLVDIKYHLEDGIIIIEYVTNRPDSHNILDRTTPDIFTYWSNAFWKGFGFIK